MKKLIIASFCLLFISTITFSQEKTTETTTKKTNNVKVEKQPVKARKVQAVKLKSITLKKAQVPREVEAKSSATSPKKKEKLKTEEGE